MQKRSVELSTFLNTLHSAIASRVTAESDEFQVNERITQALETEYPCIAPKPVLLPVCELLDIAVDNVSADSSLVDHAKALLALSPQLHWWHRTRDVEPGSPMATGHANAMVIGGQGLEERDDVSVGISLIAPGIQYPEHHHPPEEIYLVMSEGWWQKSGGEWFEPGSGVLVHNPPGYPARHAIGLNTFVGYLVSLAWRRRPLLILWLPSTKQNKRHNN